MAELAAVAIPGATKALKAGEVFIAGRLVEVRKAGKIFLHLCILPAADSFSHPDTIEIASEKRLGDKGDDLRQVCRVGGFGRTYDSTDKATGEITKGVRTANNRLTAILG